MSRLLHQSYDLSQVVVIGEHPCVSSAPISKHITRPRTAPVLLPRTCSQGHRCPACLPCAWSLPGLALIRATLGCVFCGDFFIRHCSADHLCYLGYLRMLSSGWCSRLQGGRVPRPLHDAAGGNWVVSRLRPGQPRVCPARGSRCPCTFRMWTRSERQGHTGVLSSDGPCRWLCKVVF